MKIETDNIDPILTKPHLRTIIFRSYLKYVEEFHPDVDIEGICEQAGLPSKYLYNEDNWVSIVFEQRFMDLLSKQIDDPQFVTKVGEYGVRAQVIGKSIHYLFVNLLELSETYSKLAFFTSLLNKVFAIKVIAKNVFTQLWPSVQSWINTCRSTAVP